MWRRFALIGLVCLTLSACGGDNSPESPPGGDGGGGGTADLPVVRSGDRLIWDQRADSIQAARGYTYRLYVDSISAALSSIACSGAVSAAGYECSGVLPAMSAGRHTLELTTVVNGVESARSAGLAVMVASGLTTGLDTSSDTSAPPAVDAICLGETGDECYQPYLISDGLGAVSGVVPLAGNQALFIEREKAVRLVSGSNLIETPALTLEDARARLIGIAISFDYERSHNVYVASSAPGRDGRYELAVTRYRELQGVLGEGATIVSGLQTSADASAPMAFDDEGRLYIQLPVTDANGPPSGEAASSTAVLRFESDGAVPSDNPGFSPVIASGYAKPSAMAWDPVARQMWLAGDDARWPSPVATLSTNARRQAAYPWQPRPVALKGERSSGSTEAPRLAISTTGSAPARSMSIWMVPSRGSVYRAIGQSAQSSLQLVPVTLGHIADVRAVVATADAGLLVVSEPDASSGHPSRIWRLEPILRRNARSQ